MKRVLLCSVLLAGTQALFGQEIVIPTIEESDQGTMEIAFEGKNEHYYILYRSLDLETLGEPIAMSLGREGGMRLKDRFHPSPKQVFYRVREVPNGESLDTDGDGVLDHRELRPNPFSPGKTYGNVFNPIDDVRETDGGYDLTQEQFEEYSVSIDSRTITLGLTGQRVMKFVGLMSYEPGPAVLFMNTVRYPGHAIFLTELQERYHFQIGSNWGTANFHRGELAKVFDADGRDWYVFNFQPGEVPTFENVRILYHLLTKNMTFIDGNLAYRPWDSSLLAYWQEKHRYEQEGIPVWGANDRAISNDYTALNEGEAYGLLRVFEADESPSILDVALYRELPNDVPLLRGIITETPQTPLSHVNLRAVQNQNPNAYIRDAVNHPEIKPLIGKYVHYVVRQGGFEISEASKEEVDAHLASIRPENPQTPIRDLGPRNILPLKSAGFASSSSIGVKAANLAELMNAAEAMRIPREVFPSLGFAVPFAFYHDFMKHNGFYDDARRMMGSTNFVSDPLFRGKALKEFRDAIKDGTMPAWMLEALSAVQQVFLFSAGDIRCRSSTNNEDLPGFNGAGLYDSFTHHADEGHLSKSVKQVFASLWNFIAFEHRDFYRIDHFQAAMGVLLHANYNDELANGVAVSRYDFPGLERYQYVNVQVGENLVTNPEVSSRPEEWLFGPQQFLLSTSNQVPFGDTVLASRHRSPLQTYIWEIANHFYGLYGSTDPEFAMEIEFKITKDNQLLIKQARPWVN